MAKRSTSYRNKDECEQVLDGDIRRTNLKKRQVWVNIYKQAQSVSADYPGSHQSRSEVGVYY